MNRTLEGTTIAYAVGIDKELDFKNVIIAPETKSTWTDVPLPSNFNIKGLEKTSNHHLLLLFNNLRKFVLVIEHLGAGRIDEQRLTTGEPWLEAYRFRKDL